MQQRRACCLRVRSASLVHFYGGHAKTDQVRARTPSNSAISNAHRATYQHAASRFIAAARSVTCTRCPAEPGAVGVAQEISLEAYFSKDHIAMDPCKTGPRKTEIKETLGASLSDALSSRAECPKKTSCMSPLISIIVHTTSCLSLLLSFVLCVLVVSYAHTCAPNHVFSAM